MESNQAPVAPLRIWDCIFLAFLVVPAGLFLYAITTSSYSDRIEFPKLNEEDLQRILTPLCLILAHLSVLYFFRRSPARRVDAANGVITAGVAIHGARVLSAYWSGLGENFIRFDAVELFGLLLYLGVLIGFLVLVWRPPQRRDSWRRRRAQIKQP
jgi:hypothetical protein